MIYLVKTSCSQSLADMERLSLYLPRSGHFVNNGMKTDSIHLRKGHVGIVGLTPGATYSSRADSITGSDPCSTSITTSNHAGTLRAYTAM